MKEFLSQAKLSAARGLIPGTALVVLTIFLGIVMVRIVQMDTSIPVSSTDVEAAARSNERLTQLTQWTLTTVLGLGLALVGVSWFQSTRDRNEIAMLELELKSSIREWEAQLRDLRESSEELTDRFLAIELESSLRSRRSTDGIGAVAYCIREFDRAVPGSAMQRVTAHAIVKYGKLTELNTVPTHHALRDVLPRMKEYDPVLAVEISEILLRDLRVAPTRPESERPIY